MSDIPILERRTNLDELGISTRVLNAGSGPIVLRAGLSRLRPVAGAAKSLQLRSHQSDALPQRRS
jgi:hypothetical protein